MGSIKSNLMPMSAVKQEMQSLHFPVIKEFRFFWNKVNKIRLQALLKSHLALKFKQLNNIFIYHKRNKCQQISPSLLKISVENFATFTYRPKQPCCSCIPRSGNMIKQLQS